MSNARSSYDAFISYARTDGSQHAERRERELTAAGLASWRDKRDLDPDQDFTAALERAIEQSARASCVASRRTPNATRRTCGGRSATR